MDPRKGAFPSAHNEHQRLIQSLLNAGLIKIAPENDEDGRQFLLTGKRKGEGSVLPKKIELSIEWGYEAHSLSVTPLVWAQIVSGEEVTLRSRGAYEGKFFWIQWSFNCGEIQDLYVTYGDDGGVGYEGNIFDLYLSWSS
jgi:hypothetical protein